MFYETPIFPDYLAYGLLVGPQFQTSVVRVQSGYESRNQLWEIDLRAFDGATTTRTQAERDEITQFFLAMRGRLHGFRILDVTDFRVTRAGDGVFVPVADVANAYQMTRRYASGAIVYDRPIYKPRAGSATVAGTGSYVVDYATGVVTATGAAPTSWTGQFDVPARFDQDTLPWEVEGGAATTARLYRAQQLRIVETRDFQ